jgi:hypothetical protein
LIEHVDRRRLIQHVEYEVVMLRGCLVEFTERDQGGVMDLDVDAPSRIARTAFLEVFLVHARALDDFLGTERKYADDLWAGDFIGSSWRPHEETTPLARVSPRIREEINKQLAHISTERLDKSLFPLDRIAAEIRRDLGSFVDQAGAEDDRDLDRLRELVEANWRLRPHTVAGS